MNDTQAKMLELLVKFDSLCCQHGIEYYLGGGTALGAVRHQGFLPWDDDVDLYITRNNYDKLLTCKDTFFDDSFVLVNNKEFPKYGNTLVRCVDTNSTAITRARLFDEAPKGQFIELFILDPLPDALDERNKWLTKHWIYAELMAFAFRVGNVRIYKWADEKLFEQYRARYDSEGRQTILEELENELFSIEEHETHDYCLRWGLRNIVYPIEWFGHPRLVPFENVQLPVASSVERILRIDYGDTWANIPSGDMQIAHSFAENMDIDYRTFMDDYSKYLGDEDGFSYYAPRKKASLDVFFNHCAAFAKRLRIKEAHMAGVISRLDQGALSGANQGTDFLHAYDLWRDYQLTVDVWLRQVCMNIQDDVLALFLDLLFASDGLAPVRNILSWRKQQSALPEELKDIDVFVGAVSETYSLIDCGELEDAYKLYERLKEEKYQKYYDSYDVRYLGITLEVKSLDNCSNIEGLLQEAQSLAADFPESGDALFLLAKVENASGLILQRNEHLEQAKAMTRNAFFLREIDELLPCAEDGQDHE